MASFVSPVRIAVADSGITVQEPGTQVQEMPNRRVAGILTGNGVYALLEGPDGQTVVRPGDTVGDYRVASINARSLVLKRSAGGVTYTQIVPLTDVGSTSATYSPPGGIGPYGRGGAGGFPGPPGGMPGTSGRMRGGGRGPGAVGGME